MRAAKEAAGGKYVNVLGADVARQCLEAGVLDEILMFVAPVLLGDGVALFSHPGGTHVRLERIEVDAPPMATDVWFRVAGRGVSIPRPAVRRTAEGDGREDPCAS